MWGQPPPAVQRPRYIGPHAFDLPHLLASFLGCCAFLFGRKSGACRGLALRGAGFGGFDCERGPGLELGQRRDVDFDWGLGDGLHGVRWGGVVGDFADHFVSVDIEADAAGIADGDVEGAEQELGAAEVDGIASEGVDDFHERGLDGLLALDEGDGMKAGIGRRGDTAHHALVEVAELLSAKSGRAATDSGDLDVGADSDAGLNWHIGPVGRIGICLIVLGRIDLGEIRSLNNFLVVAS